MYNSSIRNQKRRKRRLFLGGTCIALLAAAGGVLYWLPATLQDISRIAQLAVGKFSHSPVDNITPVQDELRGTIYDRNFRELSVSYQLFSLYAHPAKINNPSVTLGRLAEIVGVESDTFEGLIKQSSRVVELADDLDAEQVKAIDQLHLNGVYCKSSEQRFYPEHTAASHVLGYAGEGIGLSGVESKYDVVLQPGEYQQADAPEVDFQGNNVLGQKGTDLILTLDIELQKTIDQQLHKLLHRPDVAAGMALLVDPATGHVLALSSQPSFDPNYFWKSGPASRQNSLYASQFDLGLVRPLLIRTAAKIRDGEQFAPLLPQTVAAPDYGLSEGAFAEIVHDIGFLQPIIEDLPSDVRPNGGDFPDRDENVSVMQLGVGLASLINGGWRISPSFLDSVYDIESGQRFTLRDDAVRRTHVLTPAMGVVVRRELLSNSSVNHEEDALTLAGESARVVPFGNMSRYVQQQLFVGMIPKKKPKMLLVMALEQGAIGPLQKQQTKAGLAEVGRPLLNKLYAKSQQEQVAEYPMGKNQDNFARFLISRRVEYTPSSDNICSDSTAMPQVVGMSLRKGLQRLNQHNLRITIQGSGQIVAQSPAPGERLSNVEVCRLTLESNI